MKKILIALLIIIAFVLFIRWSAKHDQQVSAAADQYETCVSNQYHTTPSAWYADHGEYPTCQ